MRMSGALVMFVVSTIAAVSCSDANPSTAEAGAPDASAPDVGKDTGTQSYDASDASNGAWPGPNNTGVPTGTTLTDYTGPCTITVDNTVIDCKTVNCDLNVRATGVVITKSLIKGNLNTDEVQPGSFSVTDSEITAGMGVKNLTALRVNVHGGDPNVYCFYNCDIRESWIHSPEYPADNPQAHLGSFLANDNGPDGNTTGVTLIHNTFHCDTPQNPPDGGCSGDVNLFGDFGPITYVTIDHNFLRGSNDISYCFYGGDSSTKTYPYADHVVFTNNVFERSPTGSCGAYGPVTGFGTSPTNNPGNVWQNNSFDDATTVPPED